MNKHRKPNKFKQVHHEQTFHLRGLARSIARGAAIRQNATVSEFVSMNWRKVAASVVGKPGKKYLHPERRFKVTERAAAK